MIAASYFVINKFLPETWVYNETTYTAMEFFGQLQSVWLGLLLASLPSTTPAPTKPVRAIDQSITGYATNIISGLGVGMISTTFPILILAAAVVGAHELAGLRNCNCCCRYVV